MGIIVSHLLDESLGMSYQAIRTNMLDPSSASQNFNIHVFFFL